MRKQTEMFPELALPYQAKDIPANSGNIQAGAGVPLNVPPVPGDEGRTLVVDPKTGGAKETRDARLELIPAYPLWELAKLYGRGASKYQDSNWRKGYKWSLSFGAMMRHAWKFWSGETYDTETRCHHLSAVAFHAMALMEFGVTHPELDDRYKGATI